MWQKLSALALFSHITADPQVFSVFLMHESSYCF